MTVKLIYKSLIGLNNVVACFFLGLIFIGRFSMSAEASNPLTEKQVLVRMIIYGLGVSLFFSIITFVLGILFRKKMSFSWKYLTGLFFIQFVFLLAVYGAINIFMYLK